MYATILVPLDGSSFGERALPLAVALARRSDAELELVHVREPAGRGWNAPVPDTRLDAEATHDVEARVSSLADSLARETRLPVRPVLLRGEVAPAVLAYLAEHGADLLVMTSHGRGGVSRAWLGSVADALVRGATAPLLVVRAGAGGGSDESAVVRPSFRRILVPLDGSTPAEEALPHAVAFGTRGETEYLLLRVVTPAAADHPFPDPAMAVGDAAYERRLQADVEHAAAYLRSVAQSLGEVGAPARVRTVVRRRVAPAILDVAREQAVDLIVLSSRVRSATERLLIGSVADEVLRGAKVPVLLRGPRVGYVPLPAPRDATAGAATAARATAR